MRAHGINDSKPLASQQLPWASVPGFDCRFAGTSWFGDEVVWLAAEPAAPLRALMAAVHAAFPQYPPSAACSPR